MKEIILLGTTDKSIADSLQDLNIKVVLSLASCDDFISKQHSALTNKMTVDTVVVLPHALSNTKYLGAQITELTQILDLFPKSPRLLMVFSENEKQAYVSLQNIHVNYSNYTLELFPTLKLSLIAESIIGKKIGPTYNMEKQSQRMSSFGSVPSTDDSGEDFSLDTLIQQPVVKLSETNSLVVVCSILPNSGSTFVTMNLAQLFSDNGVTCSVLEYYKNKPRLLQLLGGEQEAPTKWKSVVELIRNGDDVKKESYWRKENTVFFPLSKADIGQSFEEFCILNYFSVTKCCEYSFLDVSTNWNSEDLKEVFEVADKILCIMEPTPHLQDSIQDIQETFANVKQKVLFVGNKFSSYSENKALNLNIAQMLQSKINESSRLWKAAYLSTLIPYFDPSKVQKSQWVKIPLSKLPEAKTEVTKSFASLIKHIIGE